MAPLFRIATSADESLYAAWIKNNRDATVWQSLEWKNYQESLGREVRLFLALEDDTIRASTLIVIDQGKAGSTWDCPRGPIGDGTVCEGLLDFIETMATQEKALCLYCSPIHAINRYALSTRSEQPKATSVVDISTSEEDILKQMHQKGRYNIRLAEKHGVIIEQSNDVTAFYALLQHTGARDVFTIRPLTHYQSFLEALPGAFLLLARHPTSNAVIAGLMGVVWQKTGIYYYGASSSEHRELMAPYLLQWKAIQHCRANACTAYDLLGISPPGEFDSWAGITDFKRKFGGAVVLYPQERMKVLRPILKNLLDVKRSILG